MEKIRELSISYINTKNDLDNTVAVMNIELEPLVKKMDTIRAKYSRIISDYTTKKKELTEQLINAWDTDEHIILENEHVDISKRKNKGIEVVSKNKLIDKLQEIKKLKEAIKTFDSKLLKNLAELGFFTDDIAIITVKKSIVVKALK